MTKGFAHDRAAADRLHLTELSVSELDGALTRVAARTPMNGRPYHYGAAENIARFADALLRDSEKAIMPINRIELKDAGDRIHGIALGMEQRYRARKRRERASHRRSQ